MRFIHVGDDELKYISGDVKFKLCASTVILNKMNREVHDRTHETHTSASKNKRGL